MKRARVVDLVFDGLELVASIYDWVRELCKPKAKPIPLTRPPLKK
jgi:hypothetical protein